MKNKPQLVQWCCNRDNSNDLEIKSIRESGSWILWILSCIVFNWVSKAMSAKCLWIGIYKVFFITVKD